MDDLLLLPIKYVSIARSVAPLGVPRAHPARSEAPQGVPRDHSFFSDCFAVLCDEDEVKTERGSAAKKAVAEEALKGPLFGNSARKRKAATAGVRSEVPMRGSRSPRWERERRAKKKVALGLCEKGGHQGRLVIERGSNLRGGRGVRIGEASNLGPYTEGGASSSGAGSEQAGKESTGGMVWRAVGHGRWVKGAGPRKNDQTKGIGRPKEDAGVLEAVQRKGAQEAAELKSFAEGIAERDREATWGPRDSLEARGRPPMWEEVEIRASTEEKSPTPLDMWERKQIGSRRRNGTSTPTDSNATVDLEADDKGYTLQFATANRSEKGPAEEFAFNTNADVIMLQETHVTGDHEERLRQRLKGGGWKVISAAATPTVGRGSSGGVLVAVRSRFGLGLAPGDSSGVVVESRIAAAHLAAVCKGGVVC